MHISSHLHISTVLAFYILYNSSNVLLALELYCVQLNLKTHSTPAKIKIELLWKL